jgi:hypothetical protein
LHINLNMLKNQVKNRKRNSGSFFPKIRIIKNFSVPQIQNMVRVVAIKL